MFKIGICEDSENFSLELKSIIEKKLFKFNIDCTIDSFSSGENLLNCILNKKDQYDVIFFDIDLPGLNGIETAKKVRESCYDTVLIFISYLNEKVFEVLNLNIFNFIRKSHFYEEIDSVLNLLIKNLDRLIEKYPFPIEDRNIYVKLYNILYLEVLERRVVLHTIDNKYVTKYRALTDIPYNLENKQFYQIYRGVLVNLNHVKNFQEDQLYLYNGLTLYIAKRRLRSFKDNFYNYTLSKREG